MTFEKSKEECKYFEGPDSETVTISTTAEKPLTISWFFTEKDIIGSTD